MVHYWASAVDAVLLIYAMEGMSQLAGHMVHRT